MLLLPNGCLIDPEIFPKSTNLNIYIPLEKQRVCLQEDIRGQCLFSQNFFYAYEPMTLLSHTSLEFHS